MSITRKGAPRWRVHPGEILREEFLKPLNISAYQLAKDLHVSAPRVNDIILQKRGITPDTAVRLARFFGTSEQFWLGLQASFDVSEIKAECQEQLDQIKPLKRTATAHA